MTPSWGIEPGPHWWEASALTTAPSLHPTKHKATLFIVCLHAYEEEEDFLMNLGVWQWKLILIIILLIKGVVSCYFSHTSKTLKDVFVQYQWRPKNYAVVLFPITTEVLWRYYLLFVAEDGEDGNGLKLGGWTVFSSLETVSAESREKLIRVSFCAKNIFHILVCQEWFMCKLMY